MKTILKILNITKIDYILFAVSFFCSIINLNKLSISIIIKVLFQSRHIVKIQNLFLKKP